MARKSHLETRPLGEARRLLLGAAPPLATVERADVASALGRVTAEPVYAQRAVPHYNGAAMDGIAVRADDTTGASEEAPLELTRGSPETTARPFAYVDTGNALPAWADAVVMIERVAVDAADETRARIAAPADAWHHVRLIGEDIAAGELLLARGHRLRPQDIGALLAVGVTSVALRPRPVVAILPTGSELIEPAEMPAPGRIVEFNSRMVAAFVLEWGGAPLRLAPVRDDPAELRARIAAAAGVSDVVCVIAGSSAGTHDFSAGALADLGEVLVHGVALMPGKPAILARLDAVQVAAAASADGSVAARARVALGIPGYPVSAAVICRELLEPLLAHLLAASPAERATVRARALRPLSSRVGHEELIRVSLAKVGDRMLLRPLARGASAITTMVRADGLVRVAPDVAAVEAGASVDVELLRPMAEVLGAISVLGLADPILAVLEDVLRAACPGVRLTHSSASPAEALAALGNGEAHAAALAADSSECDERSLRAALKALGAIVVHVVARRAARAVEDFDLVLRADLAASAAGRELLRAMRSDAFRAAVHARPGYDAARAGMVKLEIGAGAEAASGSTRTS